MINTWLIKFRAARLFASCFMGRAVQISTHQSDKDWHHVPKFMYFVSVLCVPKNVNLLISIWLYSKII